MDLGACWQWSLPLRQNFGTVPFSNSKESYTFLACLWKGCDFPVAQPGSTGRRPAGPLSEVLRRFPGA
jgi:hypothetical protein